MSQINILATGPANHATIVMSNSWTAPKAYPPNEVGQRFTYNVANDDRVPDDATAVLLRIKLKAYIPSGSGYAYCQADMRQYIPGEVSNHFVHVDCWPGAGEASGQGRRIPYVTIFAPIVDGKVHLDVAHGIVGRGQIEFAVYLEGYVAP